MEAAVVSMALKVVGSKLAPLLIEEYTSIVGMKRDLEELQDQIDEINVWLEERYEAVWNGPSFNWLKRLKDVAYAVDDVVDEFQLKSEKHAAAADDCGGRGIISKYVCTKPKSFILQCKVASKIKKIKRRFAEIVKQRTDYNAITNSSISVDPSLSQTNMRTGGTSTWPDVDVSSVVGRDEHKKHIISKLQETDHQLKMKIISVVGLGGSGKTTLAKLVFNDGSINNHFDFKLWIYVSQEFDVDKLVKKMFEDLADNSPGQHGMPYMRKTVSNKLAGKRFLLVLDDVWTESEFQWENFWEFLINIGGPGSRILLTTRSSKVAETVRSTYSFKLPLLSEASSWQLFIESCGMDANNLASEFLNVGKQIMDKCGGMPLAIKVLAGILHGKEHIDQWKATRDSNLLYVEGEEHRVAACLRLSYFHLPSKLKQCFTMCSMFPKGHKIDKEQLIDQWIAHDMITLEDSVDYLEYVGHEHFNSLVQMSFLQNVEEVDGRVTCGMHDLVHDLAQTILGDEFSLVVPNEATSSTKSYRYFSLTEGTEDLVPKNIFSKARAIFMPQFKAHINGIALKHAKHLHSVTIGDMDTERANAISQIKYLKYLAVSFLSCETLPEAFSNIWSLQALHVTFSYSLQQLPQSICKLKRLRTLRLSNCRYLKTLPESIGDCQMISRIDLCGCNEIIVLPDSIGNLQRLRTLNLSSCNALKSLPDSIGDCIMISSIDLCSCEKLTVLPDSIGNLQRLRTLNLSSCKALKSLPDSIGKNEKLKDLRLSFTEIERLPSSITTLRNLECLDLLGCDELVDLPEGIGNLEKLQALNLIGCNTLGGMPVGIGQLSRVQKLGLFVVGKGEKFAGISELANVSRIGEELRIRGIANVLEPNDAHMACLKQKTNIQRLDLHWWMQHNASEANTELEQAVLDGLEPPPGIKELEIHRYSGRQYARWMKNQVGGRVRCPAPFPFLRVMKLTSFPNMKHLHGLVELPCLEELKLKWMPSLESISGGPFPSLVMLEMEDLSSLGEVWMVAEGTMPDGEEGRGCCSFTPRLGQFRVGSCLTELKIENCSKLEVKPHFPLSLEYMWLYGVSEQLLRSLGQCKGSSSSHSFSHLKNLHLQMTALESLESLGELQSLQELTIRGCNSLTSLPKTMGQLTSLQSLNIDTCAAFRQMPDSLGELCSLRELNIAYLPELTCLPESICRLTTSLQELQIISCPGLTSLPQGIEGLISLEKLKIEQCHALRQMPNCLGELCSLRKLEIEDLPELTCLPESICRLTTSLQELRIISCPGLTSLPQGIEGLTSLEKLNIARCHALRQMPNCLGELCSLRELEIEDLPELTYLPESICRLTTSLQELEIHDCPGLTSLPQGMESLVSLEQLHISSCPGIKSLPEGIKGLTALKELWIWDCPDLERRCEEETGEDWHLISHIPDVFID